MTTIKALVLASSSPYRKALLERLGLTFDCASPSIDETPLPDESPEALVARLAAAKASALIERYPDRLIIGSDQVARAPSGEILTKPGNLDRATRQLRQCAGQSVCFLTGLTLLNASNGQTWHHIETFNVHFRPLTDEDIEHYLETEKPFDCAGSFKMEGLGIALFQKLEGRDPNALIGLPLIALIDGLRHFGVDVLQEAYCRSKRVCSR
nr:Maf family nucleotide pyrophosphatase [Mangrovitalea sediminis]